MTAFVQQQVDVNWIMRSPKRTPRSIEISKNWRISSTIAIQMRMIMLATNHCHILSLRSRVSWMALRNSHRNKWTINNMLQHLTISISEMINSEPHEIIGWHDPKDNFAGQSKPTPCFSISCGQADIEEKLTKQINALKGKVCANLTKYDAECTHLLCDKISSSEKTLSCISSGKWLLTFEYIEKSYNAGRFLDVSIELFCEAEIFLWKI